MALGTLADGCRLGRRVVGFATLASLLMGLALISSTAARGEAAISVDCSKDPTALTNAIGSSASGDTLVVKGRCEGVAVLPHDLTLLGRGNAAITSLFVEQGVTASASDLTITNDTPNTLRIGVSNFGTLTLTGSTVTGNGTGIFNGDSATLTLVKTKVWDNSDVLGDVHSTFGPLFAVGGIENSGVLSLISSSVRRNHASIGGAFNNAVGGILSINSPIDVPPRGPIAVTLIDSDVTANTATTTGTDDGAVGGVQRSWPDSTMTFTRSTIARNDPGNCAGFSDPACQ
jgi:hypothetical protein